MKLLLLAGTAEARQLAARLAADPRFEVIASLAGETRVPADLGLALRTGGFGGAAGQKQFLLDNEIEAVVDATHPFAARISARTQALCAGLGLAYLQVLRPGWAPGPGDDWRVVAAEKDVAAALPPGATVFLATGRKTLGRLKGLENHRVYCRQIDPPREPFPFPEGGFVVGRPPFTVAAETALFERLGVEALVVKDAGGGSDAKLRAARELGVPVVMIRRPAQPPGDKVATVAAALAWLEARL